MLMLAGMGKDSEITDKESKAEEGQIHKSPEIKCGVCAHGTLVNKDNVRKIKSPIQIIAVENDALFPEEVLEEARQSLKNAGVDHEVEVYKGVPHGKSPLPHHAIFERLTAPGFAVAGDYESKTIEQAQGRAFEGMVRWLNAH